MQKGNMFLGKIKNPKKKIIDDIIKYRPSLEKYREKLFKESQIELHYIRYQSIISDDNKERNNENK